MSRWAYAFKNYLDKFGLTKFAETDSLYLNDFERAFKKSVSIIKSKIGSQFTEFKFGEFNNEFLNDFTKSFKQYFSIT